MLPTPPLRALCLLLPLMLGGCGKWKPYVFAHGNVSVSTPPGVAFNCHDQNVPYASEARMCLAQSGDSNLMTISLEFAQQVDQDRLDMAFANMENIMEQDARGKIVSSIALNVDGARAKDIVAQTPSGRQSGRIMYHAGYLVLAAAWPKAGEGNQKEIERFVGSLKPNAR